jgi:hypothetical protein
MMIRYHICVSGGMDSYALPFLQIIKVFLRGWLTGGAA